MIKGGLKDYRLLLLLLVVPIIFLMAYMLGEDEPQMETMPVKDYTAVENPEVTAPTLPDPSTLTVPTQVDKQVAQEVAAEFVMAFHEVDGEQPFQYLENARPYMTDRLFEKFSNIPKRGTAAVQKLKPTATDLLPVDLTDNMQIWRVGVTAEEKPSGELVFAEYLVKMVKEGQEWNVDGVDISD